VNLPEDGKRYEILDGDLVVTAAVYRQPVIHRGPTIARAAPFAHLALDLGAVWE
jgi:hypothetical protein